MFTLHQTLYFTPTAHAAANSAEKWYSIASCNESVEYRKCLVPLSSMTFYSLNDARKHRCRKMILTGGGGGGGHKMACKAPFFQTTPTVISHTHFYKKPTTTTTKSKSSLYSLIHLLCMGCKVLQLTHLLKHWS